MRFSNLYAWNNPKQVDMSLNKSNSLSIKGVSHII